MQSTQGRWVLCLLLALAAGCSPAPATAPVAPAAKVTPVEAPPAYDAALVPATADAAILNVIEAVRQKHPEALWHFLPASYQADLNEVLHDFARRMDPEIWKGTVRVLRKLAALARDKEKLLRGALGGQAGGAGPGTDIENLAVILATLVESDLGDLDRLKQADAGVLLAKIGGPLLERMELALQLAPGDENLQRLGQLLDLKVRLVSAEGDAAVVEIEAPDAPPQETEFVRVEGKWIPRETQHDWIETIGEVKSRLLLLSPENLAAWKPRWMTLLATIEGILDQLDAAGDQQQFNAALQGAVIALQPLVGMIQAAGEIDDDDDAAQAPSLTSARLVTVTVRGSIDAAEVQARLTRILRTEFEIESDRVFAESTGDDELTTFTIGPVDDLDEFAGRLRFLQVESIDAQRRSIEASVRD